MAHADQRKMGAIAATRFGLGAKPGEIEAAARDPKGFLRDQIRASGADQLTGAAASSQQRLAEFREVLEERRELGAEKAVDMRAGLAQAPGQARDAATANIAVQAMPDRGVRATFAGQEMVGRVVREDVAGDFIARAQLAASTDAAFRERWANFWANHFTVSATKQITATLIGPFEAEAIRPHVFGRFVDLLDAVETHPAMLTYLDQIHSIGPDSPAAEFKRARRTGAFGIQPVVQRAVGLNENLAREIMELHTVGVNGGYTQADVTELARAMTGISIGGPQDRNYGAAVFRMRAHEPGARKVLGVSYAAGGKEQAAQILADLAAKPQTARFVCAKIARHFMADEPPPALVARLEAAWKSSGGDLAKVAEALINAPEMWDPTAAKFKTPYEFIVSSYRAAGTQPQGFNQIGPILTSLGQKPFSAPSPKGWAEDAQSWAAPDAVVKRMQFAQGFSQVAVGDRDPSMLAVQALGQRLAADTAKAIARAESRPEGFALLLMSPEFQRR